jgi:hypothetical protein
MMDLFKIREEFSKGGIMICFNGPFSHSIIEELGRAVRNHLSAEDAGKAAVLDVFAVYIELAQNVKNYFASRTMPAEEATSSIITIARKGGRYAITSGNNMYKTDIPVLTRGIDEINALDAEGLRRLARERRRDGSAMSQFGAGLGLLEIAKRCTEKMTYAVSDSDGEFAFFSLTAYV